MADIDVKDERSSAVDTANQPSVGSATTAKCVVVLNRGSGAFSELESDQFVSEIEARLRTNGWEPEICVVDGAEINSTVDRALREKVGAVIAGGGDGTTSSIARKMLGSSIPLGILPFGTLNLAARDLDTPLEPLDAVASLYPNQSTSIDVLDVSGNMCLCMAVFGVYPRLLKNGAEYHGRSWWMKFIRNGATFTKAFLNSPKMNVQLDLDSEENLDIRTRMLFVVPGEHRDEMGIIPRRTGLSSGYCSVMATKHSSIRSLVRMIFNFLVGRTIRDPEIETREATNLQIRVKRRKKILAAIDGELAELKLPVQFNLKKRALKVLKPRVES